MEEELGVTEMTVSEDYWKLTFKIELPYKLEEDFDERPTEEEGECTIEANILRVEC